MKHLEVGMIVEDQSDHQVLSTLIAKISNRPFKTRRYLGHGCGRVNARCGAWAQQLKKLGCDVLIVVSDLDSRSLGDLKKSLLQSLRSCPFPSADYSVVIPVREIEAWLLADHEAITRSLKLKKHLGRQANPEAIQRPKERLRDLVWERSGKSTVYLNTVHNEKIARFARVEQLRRCPSFRVLEDFVVRRFGWRS